MKLRDDRRLWDEVYTEVARHAKDTTKMSELRASTKAILDAIDRRTPAACAMAANGLCSQCRTPAAPPGPTFTQSYVCDVLERTDRMEAENKAAYRDLAALAKVYCDTHGPFGAICPSCAATQGPAPVEPSEPTWPEPHLMTDEERAKVAGYLRRKYAGTPRAPRMNDATPEDELDCPDSGPFCAHWGEPGNCERPCSSCGHVCHDWICEADGCKCAECTEWICEADGCKCAECTEWICEADGCKCAECTE